MFCCMQLIVTVICQLTNSVATAIYAEGNIDEIDIYKYTPYTCASNESTHSANVLFLEIYNGKMLSNFPL